MTSLEHDNEIVKIRKALEGIYTELWGWGFFVKFLLLGGIIGLIIFGKMLK